MAVLWMGAAAQEPRDTSYIVTTNLKVSGQCNYFFKSRHASEEDYHPIKWTLENLWFDASGLSVITLEVFDKRTGKRIAYEVWGDQNIFLKRKGNDYMYMVIDSSGVHAIVNDVEKGEGGVSIYFRPFDK